MYYFFAQQEIYGLTFILDKGTFSMSSYEQTTKQRRYKMKKIVVAGGGVLGSQIAFQSAYCGFDVTIWLRSQGSIGRTQPKLDSLKVKYEKAIEKMANGGDKPGSWSYGISDKENFSKEECINKVQKAYTGIKIELDLKKAISDADLIIESMAEDKNQKIEFYKKLNPITEEKTIVVTNSSTMLPSMFAKFTKFPEKYLSLHFANEIWYCNTAEVMAQPKTDCKYFDEVLEFAKAIRMVPLPVRKEKAGYLLNSMLVPFLCAGMDLYATGISDPESIDKAWTIGTGAPKGPFQILDIVGLTTVFNINKQFEKIPSFLAPFHFKDIGKMLKKYIDQGKLGVNSGEGFYKYK